MPDRATSHVVQNLELYADSLHNIAAICCASDTTALAVEHLELAAGNVRAAVTALKDGAASNAS